VLSGGWRRILSLCRFARERGGISARGSEDVAAPAGRRGEEWGVRGEQKTFDIQQICVGSLACQVRRGAYLVPGVYWLPRPDSES
jgi:hypothetical protein